MAAGGAVGRGVARALLVAAEALARQADGGAGDEPRRRPSAIVSSGSRSTCALAAGAGLTAIVGPSGAGKTTLLHVIAGLLRPGRGPSSSATRCSSRRRRGVVVPPDRRRIGYVTQDSRLFPHLTVRQNLAYGHWFTPPAGAGSTVDAVVGDAGPRRPAGAAPGAALGR